MSKHQRRQAAIQMKTTNYKRQNKLPTFASMSLPAQGDLIVAEIERSAEDKWCDLYNFLNLAARHFPVHCCAVLHRYKHMWYVPVPLFANKNMFEYSLAEGAPLVRAFLDAGYDVVNRDSFAESMPSIVVYAAHVGTLESLGVIIEAGARVPQVLSCKSVAHMKGENLRLLLSRNMTVSATTALKTFHIFNNQHGPFCERDSLTYHPLVQLFAFGFVGRTEYDAIMLNDARQQFSRLVAFLLAAELSGGARVLKCQCTNCHILCGCQVCRFARKSGAGAILLRRVRIDAIRHRAVEVAIGLHALNLSALEMLHIVEQACAPLFNCAPLDAVWLIMTTIKHFGQK